MNSREIELDIEKNIKKLIELGEFEKANNIFENYEKIAQKTEKTYSIKSVLNIINGNLISAKNILSEALELYPYSEELLLNNVYVNDLLDNKKDAIENYCKAKLFNSESNSKITDFILEYNKQNNEKLKVFQGTIEIANQVNTNTKALKRLGIEASNLNYYPSYLSYNYDECLDISSFDSIDKANVATKNKAADIISKNIDVFHFHFGSTLTLDKSDLKLLKELNKKMIMQYWGSEVRMYSKAIKLNPYVKVKNTNEDYMVKDIIKTSKYINSCIVDYELAEYVKDYYENVYYNRVAIDLEKYSVSNMNTNNKRPLIVHAPTSIEIKGSNYIIKALENLKLKYDFDFQLINGMPHEEAKKIYEKADLIIDQILIGSYGVFAVESMAMGKPVVCYISDFMKEKYPKDLPIISANPDDIENKIEYCLRNIDLLDEIGCAGRRYVEKYHSMDIVAKNNLSIYNKI